MDIPRHYSGNLYQMVNLLSGGTPRTGEGSSLQLSIFRLHDGYVYDATEGGFVARGSATNYQFAMSQITTTGILASLYKVSVAFTDTNENNAKWQRGHYVAGIRHSVTGEEWWEPFTVGVSTPKRLGHTLVYDGTNIDLNLWVEEDGVVQTDYISLRNTAITSADGTEVLSLSVLTPSDLTDAFGNSFRVTDQAVTLNAGTQYLLSCNARVMIDGANADFPLRIGLVRP